MKNHKLTIAAGLILILAAAPSSSAQDSSSIKKTRSLLITNMTDQAVYSEITNMLHLDRLYRKIFNKKVPAEDINIYDEVPDSSFFENRHARSPLSKEALLKGSSENDGPAEGPVTITKGKVEGLHPGFFIQDTKGDRYLLKFDALSNIELNSGAEVISSRFYHAIGYHVPQYSVFTFDAERLVPGENATMVDRNGFKQKLTDYLLQQYLIQLPRDAEGRLRASASKILPGENKGPFSFQGRRKDDPEDLIDHEKRRVIRALQVFGSWLNNNDVRHANTLDMWVTEDQRSYLKHYLIDFNATLGGAAEGTKPPMFSHEYFLDYGEIAKNYAGLGFRKSDWQKRLEENGGSKEISPALGYFDNRRFSPEKYKVQLPYYAFKDLTRADGFWAAKIISKFSNDDLKAMIQAGRLSSAEDAETLFKVLSERRDLIVRYWFSQVSPLIDFKLEDGKLSFTDLEETAAGEEKSLYEASMIPGTHPKARPSQTVESHENAINLPQTVLQSSEPYTLLIRVKRPHEKEFRPYVLVGIQDGRLTRTLHQD